MKKIYKAILNGVEVFMVEEENNTIGLLFKTIENARVGILGLHTNAWAISVNDEVLKRGQTLGWLKNKVEVK